MCCWGIFVFFYLPPELWLSFIGHLPLLKENFKNLLYRLSIRPICDFRVHVHLSHLFTFFYCPSCVLIIVIVMILFDISHIIRVFLIVMTLNISFFNGELQPRVILIIFMFKWIIKINDRPIWKFGKTKPTKMNRSVKILTLVNRMI